jgi:V/A-type H+-transporting ATPase subunit K
MKNLTPQATRRVTRMVTIGLSLALLGAGLAAGMACAGSGHGCGLVGAAGAGVITEQPEKFGTVLILQVLPGTQGIYGLISFFLVAMRVGLFAPPPMALTDFTGIAIFGACMPIGIAGWITAAYQGRTAAAGVGVIVKRPEEFGKVLVLAVVVETYAVFSLLATILLLYNIPLETIT